MTMILAAALALFQPPGGEGANWFLTGRGANGDAWYADLDNAAVVQGVVRVPITIDHSQDRTETAHVIRATMVITCRHRVSQWENLRAYRADGGEIPERRIALSGVHNIPPDSTSNTLAERYCPAAAR